MTPVRLKEHFYQKGSPGGLITDVKVSHKRDGTSRRFGFVGFKSELDAEAAQKWFDRTFIDSARISVSVSEVGSFSSFPIFDRSPTSREREMLPHPVLASAGG